MTQNNLKTHKGKNKSKQLHHLGRRFDLEPYAAEHPDCVGDKRTNEHVFNYIKELFYQRRKVEESRDSSIDIDPIFGKSSMAELKLKV